MESGCKSWRRRVGHIFMPLLRKASLAMLMAEGAQQRPCTIWTVIPEPPWCGERREAEKNSPCSWKKIIQTWGYARRHLLPLVTFTEELCMGPTQNSSTSPEPMEDDYIEMTTPNLTDMKDLWHQWRLYKSEDCWTRSVLCFPHCCCHPSLSPQ